MAIGEAENKHTGEIKSILKVETVNETPDKQIQVFTLSPNNRWNEEQLYKYWDVVFK